MEQQLISKKDLLARYEISYGALYRWKRIGLIPEEWFIKKATPTGQETFFDEPTITERIELILHQKDRTSLDELAKQLNPLKIPGVTLTIQTPFGTKVYSKDDILKVTVDGSKETDVTESILQLMDSHGRETKKQEEEV